MRPTVSTWALMIATLASMETLDAATPCNVADIQNLLPRNASDGFKSCSDVTGFDITRISAFPSKNQSQHIMTNRDCVNNLNLINALAQKHLGCELMIGDTKKPLGEFVTALLTGQTGNETLSTDGSMGSMATDDVVVGQDDESASMPMEKEEQTTETPVPTKKKKKTPTPAPTSDGKKSTSGLGATAFVLLTIMASAVK